jgi:hypothetical protein
MGIVKALYVKNEPSLNPGCGGLNGMEFTPLRGLFETPLLG